jgi:transcriptional regulator with XRE-family HTH domain
MLRPRLENYLRTYRRKSGLTQREVAFLLGWKNGAQLSRYEKRHTLPPLRTALAYEAIFGVPAGELFAGLRKSVGRDVSRRIGRLNTDLRERKGQGRQGRLVARKLMWLSERHGPALSQNI